MEIFRISWSFPSEIHAKPKKEKLRQKAVPSSSCHALEKWTDFFSGKKKKQKNFPKLELQQLTYVVPPKDPAPANAPSRPGPTKLQ